jgi:hypothetical protein
MTKFTKKYKFALGKKWISKFLFALNQEKYSGASAQPPMSILYQTGKTEFTATQICDAGVRHIAIMKSSMIFNVPRLNFAAFDRGMTIGEGLKWLFSMLLLVPIVYVILATALSETIEMLGEETDLFRKIFIVVVYWALIGGTVGFLLYIMFRLRRKIRAEHLFSEFAKGNALKPSDEKSEKDKTAMLNVAVFPSGAMLAEHRIGFESGEYYLKNSAANLDLEPGVVARVRLPREVPRMFLAGTRRSKHQLSKNLIAHEIALEGDFAKYFRLYAPAGRHVDALQILTPDVMLRLLDYGRKFDYEFSGKFLYVYAPYRIANNGESVKQFLTTVEVVAGQVREQVDNYHDVEQDKTVTSATGSTRQNVRLRMRYRGAAWDIAGIIALWIFPTIIAILLIYRFIVSLVTEEPMFLNGGSAGIIACVMLVVVPAAFIFVPTRQMFRSLKGKVEANTSSQEKLGVWKK